MKLYFQDTRLSYREISDMLVHNIGPSGPDTWQNGSESSSLGFRGYVEIYDKEHPGALFAVLKWR